MTIILKVIHNPMCFPAMYLSSEYGKHAHASTVFQCICSQDLLRYYSVSWAHITYSLLPVGFQSSLTIWNHQVRIRKREAARLVYLI